MESGSLGKIFKDGEIIFSQGEEGNCMYVIQKGEVEVLIKGEKEEMPIALLKEGDFFGEMAIFEHEVRSATVRAKGEARVLTVDKRNFLRRINEDPSLAFRIVETLSRRIRVLNKELMQLKTEQ